MSCAANSGARADVPAPDQDSRDLPVTVGTAFARAFDVRLVEQTTTLVGLLVRAAG